VKEWYESLNEPQREAVLHEKGPLLVLAGAGSGKTRVITTRIARLIQESKLSPYRMLGVTFTNKAAHEMLERIERFFGEPVRGLTLSTFHSTGALLLRKHPEKVGRTSQFVIYDDSDQQAMVARVMRELNISDKLYAPRALQHQINTAKNFGLSPKKFQSKDFFGDVVAKIYPVYEERMSKANAVDFGDLIYLLVELFDADEELRQSYAQRFEQILVDEFQDTNPVQYKLLQQLSSVHKNLCVVGDDDQSIYRWRGADIRNILGFVKDFPGAKVIKLEENYRSTKTILQAASQVIKHNYGRHDKTIYTSNPMGEAIHLYTLDDERREAEVVTGLIRNFVQDQGHPLREIAVFYRTHAQSRAIEEALQRSSIPYRVVGGLKFYDRAEVKDLLAYLRVLLNKADLISWSRIVNTPARGIGDTTVEKLTLWAKREQTTFWEAMRYAARGDSELVGTAAKKRIIDFGRAMGELYDMVDKIPPSELAREVLHKTGYLEVLKQEDTPESEARQENLRELLAAMGQSEQEADEPETLARFLERVSLVNQDEESKNVSHERVTLMTVHAAKGLEFDLVILTGLEEDTFPHSRSRDDADELEEERRLCYVAITRARKRLYLLNARQRRFFGQDKMLMPSRFLSDIPAQLMVSHGQQQRPAPRLAWSAGSGFSSPPVARKPAVATASMSQSRAISSPKSTETVFVPDESEQHVAEEQASGLRYRVGMRVRHNVFGIGEIRVVSGYGPSGVLTIHFPTQGVRKVLARFVMPV
jgi:DNA helicase-2/ATP-dependent DNA helicase PcrA